MKITEQKAMIKAQTIAQKCEVLAEKYLTHEKLSYYFVGSCIAFLAPITVVLLWVLLFMAFDFITGIWASLSKGYVIRSRKLRHSITKCVFYLLFICLLHGLDIHILKFIDLKLANVGGAIVCGIELYSILENMYKITGAKAFKILTRWTVKKIKENTGVNIEDVKKD